ncbi:probable pathogenesis-related protein ARB_02861 isoform X6 [Drosophila subpulchrella]|uniref:probable pathogenesis-related protein ARB_02861 isoform X6 n=1 Tax=Drosophila subpulchrella TaxID=1486046 RepID=UPI0018A18D78|nr:probable pathogenesis-related protein ARB_02861 isoform X6 [Drosophila subpulchrella]
MVYIYFDVWFPVLMVFFILILILILLRVRRARRLRMAPVVVTSATHTAPGGYPVTQLPPPGYPAGNAYAAPVGYPAQTTGNVTVQMPMPMQPHNQQQMPMPMPGMQTHGVAYPPYPGAGAASMNPPPYDMAMANPGPSVMPSGYEKQAPYNPNFGQ